MAQTAPMPAGFDAPPLDADSLPPVEAEVVPPPAPPAPGSIADREPIRRPLPQSGYLTASPAALRNLAEGEARIRAMIGPGVKHAATLAAEPGRARRRLVDRHGMARAPTRQRLTAIHRKLLHEELFPPQESPPGWLPRPEALKGSGLDADVAAGLAYLALLDERLRIIDLHLRLGRQQLIRLERRQNQANRALQHRLEQFEQRIAALETAVVRGGREI
jgi:hypothetical protein